MSSSKPGPDVPTPPDRPGWLPDTEASRIASYRLTPPAILARYDWHVGACFKCGSGDRFVTTIGARGDETDEGVVPLTMCGGCVLEQEEQRRSRMVHRELPYAPGRIGQPE